MTAEPVEELRDRLTRRHLTSTGEAPEAVHLRRFRRRWWDGGAQVPSVMAEVDGARFRLVQTGGQVIALPASGWRARRAIRRIRRRAVVDPRLTALANSTPDPKLENRPRSGVVPQQRDDHPRGRPSMTRRRYDAPRLVIRIEQAEDFVRCSGPNCAAMVQIPPPGRLLSEPACPRCGRIELPAERNLSERQTATAR